MYSLDSNQQLNKLKLILTNCKQDGNDFTIGGSLVHLNDTKLPIHPTLEENESAATYSVNDKRDVLLNFIDALGTRCLIFLIAVNNII